MFMFLRLFTVSFIHARTHDCPGLALMSSSPQNKILTMSQCRESAANGLALYQRARVSEIADLGSWC